MDLLTTKTLSELWGITPQRITVLANQGRIEGAKKIDGRWFFPENAAKPDDLRKERTAQLPNETDRYIFPFPLATVKTQAELDGFTEEEKTLYRLCLLYEQGHFAEARKSAERLLSSNNPYIRFGALNLLPVICMYLWDFKAAEDYFVRCHTAGEDEQTHKTELNLLLMELDGELLSGSEYVKFIDLSDVNAYSDELLPVIGAYKLFADTTKFQTEGQTPNIQVYEILCRMTEGEGHFYCAMLMHLYLSMYYAFVQNSDAEYRHMKSAFEIGLAHDIWFTLSYIMCYNPEISAKILSEQTPELKERMEKLSEIYMNARNAYANFQGKQTILAQLNKADYRLISCCLKSYSIEKIADIIGLTRSGVNKRLAALYKKLGVKSKKELRRMYIHSILDWGEECAETCPITSTGQI